MDTTTAILTVTGIYQVSFGLIMHTTNARSALVFKVIPFLLGLACLYAAWVLPS